MSLVRRLLSPLYRRARRAEARGQYRDAAALYIEADMPEEAANALLFHAARATEVDERLEALHDALRWLAPEHPRRVEVEAQIGLAILEDSQRHGVHTTEERHRLAEAAERLERVDKPSEAATAFEILGRRDDMARCLEKAGDIERLEELLEESSAEARRERELRRHVSDYEMSVALGARVEARAALQSALAISPDDAALVDLLRRLEARMIPGKELVLRVSDRDVAFVGKSSVALGRDADVVVRGASVSRRHTEVSLRGGKVVVSDLGSRNGTLVRGVPLSGEMELEGATEIGMGDDVTIRVERSGNMLRLEVMGGLDRGLVILVGEGALPIPDVPATVSFPGAYPTVTAHEGITTRLGSQKIVAPVSVLREDLVEIEGYRLEVR